MEFGTKIGADNKVYCVACGSHVGNDRKTQMNFCPKCGTHLTLKSAALYENRVNKEHLELLYSILDEIDEGVENPRDIVESYIAELSNND